MKAEERIVKTTEENCHNTLEERLAEQDRISFKAGREAEREFILQNTDGDKRARLEGIKEVVEWSDGPCPHYRGLGKRECDKCWQALKKKWGIE